LAASDLCGYHVLLVTFANEVLLDDAKELTDVGVALNHILEALQAINLDQLLLKHLKLLYLLTRQRHIVLCLFQMKLGLRFLILRFIDFGGGAISSAFGRTLLLFFGLFVLLLDELMIILQLLLQPLHFQSDADESVADVGLPRFLQHVFVHHPLVTLLVKYLHTRLLIDVVLINFIRVLHVTCCVF